MTRIKLPCILLFGLSLAACGDEDDGDDEGADTGTMTGNPSTTTPSTSDPSDPATSNPSDPTDPTDPTATTFPTDPSASSDPTGFDTGDPTEDPTEDPTDDPTGVPGPCTTTNDCPGFQPACMACGVNDTMGFCIENLQECEVSTDCGANGYCAYSVVDGATTSNLFCVPQSDTCF